MGYDIPFMAFGIDSLVCTRSYLVETSSGNCFSILSYMYTPDMGLLPVEPAKRKNGQRTTQ